MVCIEGCIGCDIAALQLPQGQVSAGVCWGCLPCGSGLASFHTGCELLECGPCSGPRGMCSAPARCGSTVFVPAYRHPAYRHLHTLLRDREEVMFLVTTLSRTTVWDTCRVVSNGLPVKPAGICVWLCVSRVNIAACLQCK